MGMGTGSSFWECVYAAVRRIPRGRVATYAQVALVAGRPRAARQVGFALAALRGTKHRVPWQRVVGKRSVRQGRISILDPMGAAVQRTLLEGEGVLLDEEGRIDLERFGWRPRVSRAAADLRPAVASVRSTPPPRRARGETRR